MSQTDIVTAAAQLEPQQIAVLDALVWHALDSTHRHLAEGDGLARRYQTDVAGFVAIADRTPQAWDDLAELVGPDEIVMLSGNGFQPPDHWTREGGGYGYQMILPTLGPAPSVDASIVRLVPRDVPAMLALVELTQPGPFRQRTIELGNYFGVFAGGELIAMAGERLQTPEFTEVSAVCTHPTARGRGIAAALTHHVATGIVERGQTPILHVAEHNHNAKRVYERLGFVERRKLEFVAARTPSTPPSGDSAR